MKDPGKINVLHVIDKLSMDGINPSSCTILFGEWIPYLDSSEFNTTVLTLRKPDPAGAYLEKRGIKVYYQGYGKISSKNINGIREIIERERADIVHLHGYSAANFGRIATRRYGVPNIVHEHAVLKVMPHQYAADYLLKNYTDIAVAVSNGVKDFMIRGRSVPQEKIQVIMNGIKLDKFRKSSQEIIEAKRSELGIPDTCKVVGTVTRLREEKGNEYFIRAVPRIREGFPDSMFLIVGDGPLRKDLESLASDLGVSDCVQFLGFRTDVPDLLSTFDVNVIPSLTEGFPLSLVEAMAIGNAIVATRVGGMKEVGKNEENVIFIPPKDPPALARETLNLLHDPELCSRISTNARECSEQFSVEENARLLGMLYKSALNQGVQS